MIADFDLIQQYSYLTEWCWHACKHEALVFLATPKVLLPPTVGVKEFWGRGDKFKAEEQGGSKGETGFGMHVTFL